MLCETPCGSSVVKGGQFYKLPEMLLDRVLRRILRRSFSTLASRRRLSYCQRRHLVNTQVQNIITATHNSTQWVSFHEQGKR